MKVNETKAVLAEILKTPFGEICEIKVKSMAGEAIVQRCRVELSRLRSKVIKRYGSDKLPKFKLKADIVRIIGQNYDLIKFIKIRENNIIIDMSELDEIVDQVVKESQEEEEKKKQAEKKGIVLRIKQGVA